VENERLRSISRFEEEKYTPKEIHSVLVDGKRKQKNASTTQIRSPSEQNRILQLEMQLKEKQNTITSLSEQLAASQKREGDKRSRRGFSFSFIVRFLWHFPL
jgi:hypothetical protein